MAKRRKHAKPRRTTPHFWTPFAPAVIPLAELREIAQALNLPLEQIEDMAQGEHYLNNRYQVHKRVYESETESGPPLVWLSIKRLDRRPIRDWRDLQRIKNELVGAECEGVELYPAESRRVDLANQFHVFIVADPTFRFPFGFQERAVDNREVGKAKQRRLA